jgi:hypothetical protein
MARIDKYEPKGGGFRAPLGFTAVAGDLGVPFGVSIDNNGRVVKGGDATHPIAGVLVLTKIKATGDIVDVMTHGEITEFGGGAAGATAVAMGLAYAAAATGLLSATGGVGTKPVGYVVDSGTVVAQSRLVVRVSAALNS